MIRITQARKTRFIMRSEFQAPGPRLVPLLLSKKRRCDQDYFGEGKRVNRKHTHYGR